MQIYSVSSTSGILGRAFIAASSRAGLKRDVSVWMYAMYVCVCKTFSGAGVHQTDKAVKLYFN